MPEKLKTVQRVMSGHPVVSAALWHVPSAQGEAYARERWFVPEDLAECEGFTHGRRIEEWLAARIALKTLLVEDGLAESPLHIHIRKNGQGSPHVVVYNPETGAYARLPCSLSHKGPLVLAAYSRHAYPDSIPLRAKRILDTADHVAAILTVAQHQPASSPTSASAADAHESLLRPLWSTLRGARLTAVNAAAQRR